MALSAVALMMSFLGAAAADGPSGHPGIDGRLCPTDKIESDDLKSIIE